MLLSGCHEEESGQWRRRPWEVDEEEEEQQASISLNVTNTLSGTSSIDIPTASSKDDPQKLLLRKKTVLLNDELDGTHSVLDTNFIEMYTQQIYQYFHFASMKVIQQVLQSP